MVLTKEPKWRRPQGRLIRFIEYFATPSGRRLSFYLAGAGALGLAGANYMPHTVCLDYYREFIQHYTFGLPTKVPEEVNERIYRAADKLNINDSSKNFIKSFTVTGFNIVELGSLNSVYGGWIGVPSNFYYKSAEDIDKVNTYIRNQKVKWDSEHGKMLQESLILSDSEQIFAFCRSLMDLQSFKLYWKTITPSAVFLAIYFAAQKINHHQNLYGRPFVVRYVIYAMLGVFGYGLSSLITDFFNFQHGRKVDIEMANLGPEMIEAGVSFYTKQLNRNIAIREISGLDLYTAKGNENYLFRIRTVPLTVRKAFLERKLEELRKSEDESTTDKEETSAADQAEKQS